MNQDDSPVRTWLTGWVDFASGTLPVIFTVVVVAVGMLVMVRRGNKKKGIRGGLRAALVFGVAAALVYLLLTNVAGVADLFGEELPIGQG